MRWKICGCEVGIDEPLSAVFQFCNALFYEAPIELYNDLKKWLRYDKSIEHSFEKASLEDLSRITRIVFTVKEQRTDEQREELSRLIERYKQNPIGYIPVPVSKTFAERYKILYNTITGLLEKEK